MTHAHCALSTSLFIMHTIYCTLYTAHFALHTLYCTLYTAHSILHTLQCRLYTEHFILHTLQCTLYTEHIILHTSHTVLYTAHFIIHTTHQKLHTAKLICTFDVNTEYKKIALLSFFHMEKTFGALVCQMSDNNSKTKSEMMKLIKKIIYFFILSCRSWDFKPLLEKAKPTSADSSSDKPKALIRNVASKPLVIYLG